MVVTWTYDAPSNTATASGSGTTNFAALIAADQAGPWNKFVADATGSQIVCAAKIIIPNTVTLADTEKQILLLNGVMTANNQNFISVSAGGTVTFGTVVDAATFKTKAGCSFVSLEASYYHNFLQRASSTSTINIYSCSFSATTQSCWIDPTICWNCLCSGFAMIHTIQTISAGSLQNYISSDAGGLRRPRGTMTINNIFIMGGNSGHGLWFQSYGSIVKNVWMRGITDIRCETIGANDQYLINVDWQANWVLNWATPTDTGRVYRQYEFDLQAVDNQNDGAPLQGARYRIFDKNNNELTKTGSGYVSVPNVVLTAPPQGGTQATAHAILEPNSQGAISSFIIDNPGSGYLTPPTITVDAPASGVTATAIATLTNGAVSGIVPTTFTDANGSIPTRCVTRGYYDQAHGNALQDYAPLLIVITKNGYQEYRDEMNIAMKTAYQVSMNRAVPVLVGANGKLQVDLMPANPVNMMLMDIG